MMLPIHRDAGSSLRCSPLWRKHARSLQLRVAVESVLLHWKLGLSLNSLKAVQRSERTNHFDTNYLPF